MIRNHLLLAIRNILRNPAYSLIKILGLTVGVCGCLVIFLLARFELSFDRSHPDGDKIYRIYSQFSGLWEGFNRGVPKPLPYFMRDNFTGIAAIAAVYTYGASVTVPTNVATPLRIDRNSRIAITDSDYFKVFSGYKWIAGSPDVLEEPFSTVITASRAKEYFGNDDPLQVLGRALIYSDSLEVTVRGIVADPVGRTDLDFTDFISFSTTQKSWMKSEYNLESEGWGGTSSSDVCFLRLLPGTPVASIEAQIPLLLKEKRSHDDSKMPETTFTHYKLQPLDDLHFNSSLGIFNESRSPASLSTIRGLIVIALILLSIAGINFVNLETAQASRRAKEVGLRKVMGSSHAKLIGHFLAESLVVAGIAVLLALPLAKLALILFNEFLPAGMTMEIVDPFLYLFAAAAWIIVGLLAGIYPSLVLSSFLPAVALRNQKAGGATFLRKILTVFQFSFSQALIAATLVVGLQIKFMIDKDPGFRRDAIVSVTAPWWEKASKRQVLRNELEKIAGVEQLSQNSRPPASNSSSSSTMTFTNNGVELPMTVYLISGDEYYLDLFDLQLIAGRNVVAVDSLHEVVINQAFCAKANVQPIDMLGRTFKGNGHDWTVVGVVKDFHFSSLHKAIEPVTFNYKPDQRVFSLLLSNDGGLTNVQQKLDAIKSAWKQVFPDEEPNVVFIDETIKKFYASEERTAKLANTATSLAIFISCLGLLGLASFTALQRTKEVGIRKVLGASVTSIVRLLSLEFLLLVGIAFVIAVPAAWYAADQWLSGFAYKMEFGWWIFAITGITAGLIAFLTVGSQSLRAAVANPVDSLRYE